jgi:hypothetical protein
MMPDFSRYEVELKKHSEFKQNTFYKVAPLDVWALITP